MTVNMASKCTLSLSLFTMMFISLTQTYNDEPIHLLCYLGNYEYYNITAAIWTVSLGASHCLPMNDSSREPPSECTIFLAVCQKLPESIGCHNSSVCQGSSQGALSLGAFSEDPLKVATVSGVDGFYAKFHNGSNYTSTDSEPCNLRTSVAFRCNHSAHWQRPETQSSKAVAPSPRTVMYNGDDCELSLTFDYAGACHWTGPAGENMSPGTVLLIIFSVSLILYFTFGCMLNMSRGRTGSQIIPHSNFWTMLPVYIMDGCQYAICCGKVPVTDTAYDKI